jgi:hypothetical protein
MWSRKRPCWAQARHRRSASDRSPSASTDAGGPSSAGGRSSGPSANRVSPASCAAAAAPREAWHSVRSTRSASGRAAAYAPAPAPAPVPAPAAAAATSCPSPPAGAARMDFSAGNKPGVAAALSAASLPAAQAAASSASSGAAAPGGRSTPST